MLIAVFFLQGSPGSRSGFLSPKSLAAVVSNAENRNLFVRGKLEDFLLLKNKVANSLQRILVVQDVHLILQKHKQISGKQVLETVAFMHELFCNYQQELRTNLI